MPCVPFRFIGMHQTIEKTKIEPQQAPFLLALCCLFIVLLLYQPKYTLLLSSQEFRQEDCY